MIWRLTLALVLLAAPAHAGPVAALVGLLSGAAGFTGAISFGAFFSSFFGRILLSVGVSFLSKKLAGTPGLRSPGIRTEVTQTGEDKPQTFILGRYATGGQAVCPPMSHGKALSRLTYVIELGDIDGCALDGLIVNDEAVTVDWGASPDAVYGYPVTGTYAGKLQVRFRDGTQTTADSGLMSVYGPTPAQPWSSGSTVYPERPWSADMTLRGSPYVILTFTFDNELFQGLPGCRFVVLGIPLYDPRADTTVGGSGAQRWDSRATWVRSLNPAVMAYNILRGITLSDGSVWGGGVSAADLPLANWFTAMNECDVAVPLAAGGTEPRFRAGLEVAVTDEPRNVLDELMKACGGELAESGGTWRIRLGGPGLPVMTVTDDDLSVSDPQSLAPYGGLATTFNAIDASYPEPASLWEQKNAPPLYNAPWEVLDGNRRLIADLALPAVPYPNQVQRLMRAYIQNERRPRRHVLNLPPRFAVLEPLDATAWTSAANGYSAKVFEADEAAEDPMTMVVRVTLQEREAGDWTWSTANEIAQSVPSVAVVPPPLLALDGWAVTGVSVGDGVNPRRPGLQLAWTGTDLAGARGLNWEIRPTGGATILRGSVQAVAGGTHTVTEGLVASTAYEARAMLVSDSDAAWTSWAAATTPATLMTRPDIADGAVSDQFQVVELGPFTIATAPTNTVLATLDMGEIPPGTIWRRGLSFTMRSVADSGTNAKVELQRRFREFGGAFNTWATVFEFITPGNNGVWDQRTDSGGLSGAYDDWEYRLIVTQRPGGGGTPTGYEWIKDIYLTMARVTK